MKTDAEIRTHMLELRKASELLAAKLHELQSKACESLPEASQTAIEFKSVYESFTVTSTAEGALSWVLGEGKTGEHFAEFLLGNKNSLSFATQHERN
jgi:hypothetical protein